jgi:ribokinase
MTIDVLVVGSINQDIVCQVAELPAPGQTVAGFGIARHPGGKGLNQAVAAARWGASTAMIGQVGDDAAGDQLLEVLHAAGVDVTGIGRLAGGQTGQALIFVSTAGENMIVVAGGVNLSLAAPPVSPAAKVVLAQLETPVATTAAVFEQARAAGAMTLLNAAPALPEGAALFALADVIIVNQTERASYGALLDGRRLVVTLGAAGASLIESGAETHVVGEAARVVDTTGAGDCFCGVLAAGLAAGAEMLGAMAIANAAAARSTETAGAASSMPVKFGDPCPSTPLRV